MLTEECSVEECKTVLKCLQDGIYYNEVLEGGPKSTLPANVVAQQVAEDMDRLIERYTSCKTLPSQTVVSIATACKNVVSIADPQKRREAAVGSLEMSDLAVKVFEDMSSP
jgi:hypothetical protein